MKFSTILSTVLAVAVPTYAAGDDKKALNPAEFTFDLPGIYAGGPNPSMAVTVNLTGVNPSAFANNVKGISVRNGTVLTAAEYGALSTAISKQIPQYLSTYQGAMSLASSDCDLTCCEEACFALILLPLILICIGICKDKHPGEFDPDPFGGYIQ